MSEGTRREMAAVWASRCQSPPMEVLAMAEARQLRVLMLMSVSTRPVVSYEAAVA